MNFVMDFLRACVFAIYVLCVLAALAGVAWVLMQSFQYHLLVGTLVLVVLYGLIVAIAQK